MTTPLPRSISMGMPYLQYRNMPVRLIAMMRSQSSSVQLSVSVISTPMRFLAEKPMPALL